MIKKTVQILCLIAVFALGFSVQVSANSFDGVTLELNDNKAFVFSIPSETSSSDRGKLMTTFKENNNVLDVRMEGNKVKVYGHAQLTTEAVEAILAQYNLNGILINVIEY
ncbi:MAG: hypothetical protein AAF738_09365 [Bacteroidota bacterium]